MRDEGAARRGLVERVAVHQNRFRWTARLVRLLGQVSDPHLARLAGVSEQTVATERRLRSIPSFQRQSPPFAWSEESLALLGTDTDRNVAAVLEARVATVGRKRRLLGIEAYGAPLVRRRRRERAGFRWTRWAVAQLGTASDRVVGKRLGLSHNQVQFRRQQFGIPSFRLRTVPVKWSSAMLKLLGKVPDVEVMRRFSLGKRSVQKKRRELGVAPFQYRRKIERTRKLARILRLPNPVLRDEYALSETMARALRHELGVTAPDGRGRPWRWSKRVVSRLGKAPDTVLARELGVTAGAVGAMRRRLGIAPRKPKRRWTKAELSLLGTAPDAVIARRLGRGVPAVKDRRSELHIPIWRG